MDQKLSMRIIMERRYGVTSQRPEDRNARQHTSSQTNPSLLGMVKASTLLELGALRAMCFLAVQSVTSATPEGLARLNALNTSLIQVQKTLAQFISDSLSPMTPIWSV